MIRVTAILCAATVTLAPAMARAVSFVFTSQERWVSLQDVPRGTDELVSAEDFSDFDAVLGAGQVSIESSLTADAIVAIATHDVEARTRIDSGGVLEHFVAESFFETVFTLDEAAAYTVDAELAVLGYFVTDVHEAFPWFDNQLLLEASLLGPSGPVFELAFDLQAECGFQEDCSFSEPLSQAGILAPGSYTLRVRSFGVAEAEVVCIGIFCSGGPTEFSTTSDGIASVDLRIVPEPHATTLQIASLLTLAALARWRGRRRLEPRRTPQRAVQERGRALRECSTS